MLVVSDGSQDRLRKWLCGFLLVDDDPPKLFVDCLLRIGLTPHLIYKLSHLRRCEGIADSGGTCVKRHVLRQIVKRVQFQILLKVISMPIFPISSCMYFSVNSIQCSSNSS